MHVPSVFGGSLCYTVQTLVGARTLCIRGVTLLHCPDTSGCTYPLYRGSLCYTVQTLVGARTLCIGGQFATLSRHWWVHVPSVSGVTLLHCPDTGGCTYPLYRGSLCYTVQTLVGARTLCIRGVTLLHCPDTSGCTYPLYSGVTLLHCPDTGGCTYPLYSGGHFATLSRHWWVHVPSVFGGSLCYTVQTLVGARTLRIRGVTLLHCPDTGECTYPLYSGGHLVTLSRHWWVHVPSVFGGSPCYTVQTLVGARTLCIRGVTLLHCPDTGGCTYPLYSGGHFATLSRHWWVHVPSVFGGSPCYTVQTLVSARTLCIRGVTLLHCPDTGGCTYPLYSGGHFATLSRHWWAYKVPHSPVGHFLKVQSPLNLLKLTGCFIRVREVGTN